METKISDKVEDLAKSKAHNSPQLNEFIKASEDYKKLIQEGLAMERGFNLMTTEEIYNPSNCSYSQSGQQR